MPQPYHALARILAAKPAHFKELRQSFLLFHLSQVPFRARASSSLPVLQDSLLRHPRSSLDSLDVLRDSLG